MVYYCIIPGASGLFIGAAKLEPFTSTHPDPMTEPGKIWTAFDRTEAGAYWKITDKMIQLGLEKNVVFCRGGL